MLGHSPYKWQRNALVVVAFHDLEEVDAEDFEHHDEVLAIGPRVDERVQELHSMTVFNRVAAFLLVHWIVFLVSVYTIYPLLTEGIAGDHVQNLNLIIGCLRIVRSTLLDFESDVGLVHLIASEPYCGKVAPAQLLHDHVAIDQDFTDVDRVIPPDFVVSDALVFTLIGVREKFAFGKLLAKSSHSVRSTLFLRLSLGFFVSVRG